MKKLLCVFALGIVLIPTAHAEESAKLSKSDKAELFAIVKETKSPDAFLLTLKVLVDVDPNCDGLLPLVIRRADELGLLKGIWSEKKSKEQEVLSELLEEIHDARTAKKDAGGKRGLIGACLEAPKQPAEFPLKPQGKNHKEEVRVVVLTSCSVGITPDMIGVDRLLGSQIIPLLDERCKANKEKVNVLKSATLDAYKRDNPDWKTIEPKKIGEHFKADYVIDIEVISMSMYEPGTRNELMRGRATISMKAYDISNKEKVPDYDPVEFNFEFPRTNPVPVVEEPKSTFRQRFIKKVAEGLVLPFTAHTTNQRTMVD